MITLKTLPKATEQQVFDQVAKHLLTQNKKSRAGDNGGCKYRGPNGLKCAIGCLISDKEYKPCMDEDGTVLEQIEKGNFPDAHNALLDALQETHDYCDPEEWPEELAFVAKRFNLKFNPEKYQ